MQMLVFENFVITLPANPTQVVGKKSVKPRNL